MILVVFFLLLVVVPAESQPQWKALASPTSRNLNKVCFIDSLEGWVAGDTGTILHTSDGGNNWTRQNPGILDDITELFMLDRRFGWAGAASPSACVAVAQAETTARFGPFAPSNIDT